MDETELATQTLDQIPQTKSNTKHITCLVKEGGRVTGYQPIVPPIQITKRKQKSSGICYVIQKYLREFSRCLPNPMPLVFY